VVAVDEAEIVEALRALAHRGFYVEPTSAAAAAGLTRLQASGALRPSETTVLVLTGSGLKASAAIGDLLKLGARRV
jgi:threonine synthase